MKTNIILSVFFFAVVMVPMLMAESPTERAFTQARAERDKAAAVVLEPVNRRYKDALDKLYRQAIEASDLETAKQIQAELQAVGGAAAAADPGNPLIKPTAPPVNPADKAALKRLVEDSEWSAWKKNEPKGDPIGIFVFRKGGETATTGEGFQQFRFWDVAAPNTLTIYRNNPKKIRDTEKLVMRVNMADKTASRDGSVSTINNELSLKYVGPAKKK